MKQPRIYPPFASPGWVAAYTAGALSWLSIAELWGAVVVVALLAFAVLCLAGAAHALGASSDSEDS